MNLVRIQALRAADPRWNHREQGFGNRFIVRSFKNSHNPFICEGHQKDPAATRSLHYAQYTELSSYARRPALPTTSRRQVHQPLLILNPRRQALSVVHRLYRQVIVHAGEQQLAHTVHSIYGGRDVAQDALYSGQVSGIRTPHHFA